MTGVGLQWLYPIVSILSAQGTRRIVAVQLRQARGVRVELFISVVSQASRGRFCFVESSQYSNVSINTSV